MSCLSATCVDPGTGSGAGGQATGGAGAGGTGSGGQATGGTGSGGQATGGTGSGGQATGGTGSGGQATGGTGPVEGTVLLQNDGFTSGGLAVFQQGFVAGECWSVTYEPAPGDYPFQVISVDALVGQVEAQKMFLIRVHSVDANDTPSTVLASGEFALSGSGVAFNQIVFSDAQIVVPVIESGKFAVALCQTDHDGEPSIARDSDGSISSSLNHIRADGIWLRSNVFGVAGDWIQRVSIKPL